MKMTDQQERDLIAGEMMNGLARRDAHADVEDVKAAAVVMGLMLFAALLMIWLGR